MTSLADLMQCELLSLQVTVIFHCCRQTCCAVRAHHSHVSQLKKHLGHTTLPAGVKEHFPHKVRMSDLNKYSCSIVRNPVQNQQMQLYPPARIPCQPSSEGFLLGTITEPGECQEREKSGTSALHQALTHGFRCARAISLSATTCGYYNTLGFFLPHQLPDAILVITYCSTSS